MSGEGLLQYPLLALYGGLVAVAVLMLVGLIAMGIRGSLNCRRKNRPWWGSFLLALLLAGDVVAQSEFTEFYCNASTGNNMNGGSDENASPSYTATNGGWDSTTGVFTPTSGDPSASVTANQFASVFADGATTPVYVARVQSVNATTITLSTSGDMGTPPATAASGISIRVGGCWKGPNGAVDFPLGMLEGNITNSSFHPPRINLKNNATYTISSGINMNSAAANGPSKIQGYTTTPGDGGKTTIDGGGNDVTVLTTSGNTDQVHFADLIISNSASSGNGSGISLSNTGNNCIFERLVFTGHRRYGFLLNSSSNHILIECEAYGNNTSNTGSIGAFTGGSAVTWVRCIAHHNTESNTDGFRIASSVHTFIDCIADSNGEDGLLVGGGSDIHILNCDFYNNASDGVQVSNSGSSTIYIENCNFASNAGWGYNGSGTGRVTGVFANNGFTSGTTANVSGTATGLKSMFEVGTVTYAANVLPWSGASGGDFTVTLAAAKGAGRGAFTQTSSGYTGSSNYSDIGAVQHEDAGGGGGVVDPFTSSIPGVP